MKLAEKADLSVGYIYDLEAGKRWGTPETFAKLSNALGIRAFELLVPGRAEISDSDIEKSSIRAECRAEISLELRKNLSDALKRLLGMLRL